jgi:hypothetical protein
MVETAVVRKEKRIKPSLEIGLGRVGFTNKESLSSLKVKELKLSTIWYAEKAGLTRPGEKRKAHSNQTWISYDAFFDSSN